MGSSSLVSDSGHAVAAFFIVIRGKTPRRHDPYIESRQAM